MHELEEHLKMNASLENATLATSLGYPLELRNSIEVIVEIVVGCILFILGITGNGLVCYVITRSRYTKSSMYFFMGQLAIADILVCSVSIPLTLLSTHPTPLLLLQNDVTCKVVRFIQYLLPPASVSILTATAADRFLLICYPLKFLYHTKVKLLAICCWLYAMILTLPEIHLINSFPVIYNNKVYHFCAIKETSSDSKLGFIFLTIRAILGFLTPLLTIIILYYNILKTIWKRRTIKNRMRRNAIKSLTMVVFAFFLSWAPFSVISKYCILVEKRYNSISRAEIITFWIGLSASVYNPLIYAFYNKNFRDAFREVVIHKKTRRKPRVVLPPPEKAARETVAITIPGVKSRTPVLLKHTKLG